MKLDDHLTLFEISEAIDALKASNTVQKYTIQKSLNIDSKLQIMGSLENSLVHSTLRGALITLILKNKSAKCQ